MRGINKREIPIGMLVLLVLLIMFMFRFMQIAASKDVRENLSYIQLLNAGMPVAKGSYYDEDAYVESNITLQSLALETLNIKPLDPIELVMKEIPYFGVANEIASIDSNLGYVSAEDVDSFNLNRESIDELSEEEKNEVAESKVSKDKNVYDSNLKRELNQSKPEVLIYHTHNSEGYNEERTSSNEAHNVVGIGSLVTKELQENYGISVIHDKTIHSASYEQSYNKSRETVKKYTDEYDDFKMVIDIHRDSVGEHNKKNLTANINGENVAKIMFVTTRNNQYFNDAEALAYRFIDKANELFPEILRRQETYKYNRGQNAFNQDFNKNSMLIEVGAEVNTSAEAQASAKYIARLIAEEINREDE
ncbi:stage II sporulation protein P [Clostridium sp. B9]|uniref:stage II sporulation protein P n=1 Tax=Clostridium sp. B9 TaxID=3423224 RepID=UPI003D2EB930